MKRQAARGFVLMELLLATVVVSILVGLGAVVYSNLRSGINADDQASKTISLAASIQKNWRAAGTYASLTPTAIGNLTLVPLPMKFDGTSVITDAWGNTMTFTGAAGSFAITIGDSTFPLRNDECVAVATRLADGVAQNINVGLHSAVSGTGGVVVGGSAFKTGTVISQANLITGCAVATPKIVAQFR